MIKLNWAQIRDPDFNPLMNRLLQAKVPSYKIAKRILDVIKDINVEQKKSDEMWAQIAQRYLEPIDVDNQQFMRIKAEFDEKHVAGATLVINEFNRTEVEIDRPQLSPSELEGIELSALDLQKLSGLFDETAES